MAGDHRQRERERWRNAPRERPAVIEIPGPRQESVWDYPRPPAVEDVAARLRVEFGGVSVADTEQGLRVIETSSPPVYYFPLEDVRRACLEPSEHRTFCEWKGLAQHWSLLVAGRRIEDAAWSYPEPEPEYGRLRDHLAFYPSRVDACYVGRVRAEPQPGRYYGGWITPAVVGPFKGGPGSERW